MYKVPFPPPWGGIESSCWGRKSSEEEGKGKGRRDEGEEKGRGKKGREGMKGRRREGKKGGE